MAGISTIFFYILFFPGKIGLLNVEYVTVIWSLYGYMVCVFVFWGLTHFFGFVGQNLADWGTF